MRTDPEESPIDWAEVHRRVEAARRAVERGWVPSPDEKRRILRDRAKALTAEPDEAPAGLATIDVVTFSLSDETYGIELPWVREVYPLAAVTPLPSTPSFVLGLINVRGQILSIIDLRKFFQLPEKGPTALTKVIILQQREMELGILADEVLGVRAIRPDALQPAVPTLTGIREAYLKAVTRDRLVLLDGERILSDPNIVVDEHVEE